MMVDKSFMLLVKNIKDLNISQILEENYRKRMGVVLDQSCPGAKNFLTQCKNIKCFDNKHFWLILSNSPNYTQTFENVNLEISSEIKVAYPKTARGSRNDGSSEEYVIDDVYNPAYKKGGDLKISTVGHYDKLRGYWVDLKQNKYFERRNLTGITLKGIVVLPDPFDGTLKEYLKSNRDKEWNTFNRFHNRLMTYCGSYYNVSFDVKMSKSWGYIQPNGYFDGLVGALSRKEIDVGLSPVFVKIDRLPHVTYGRKTWNLRAAFILRNPKSRKSYQIFLKPLSVSVWIGIIISCSASVMALWFSYKLENAYNFIEKADATLSYIVLSTFGAFCQQGVLSSPPFVSGRIVIIFTLLLGSLVYQFYSASLVSFLLNVPTTLITNLQGILDQGFKIGCQDTLYDRQYLSRSTDNVTKQIYRIVTKRSTDNETGFLEAEVGLKLMKEGQYAFHVGLEVAYPIIQATFDEATICELREVPMWGQRHVHGIYQKHSPLKDVFDVCLNRLSENGVLNREYQFWHPKKPECLKSGSNIKIHTGLEDFYPALVVLLLGIVASLQILAVEILWRNRNITSPFKKDTVYPYCN
ncbi:ionotropic receptor 75a-like [Sitophilus oryzae]|uniref:Ionotropic receptor 75a-like n=1 Tax=Sitophilus oryzae TaxID=7048 RepID=A0A6J2YLL9_SITOR|nr:ionotropic receptor 75a-like [Sitophilus oryzae]